MASSARDKRRYPTDLTDRQWKLIERLLPEPPPGPAGRPRKHPRREIVNAILYQGARRRVLADAAERFPAVALVLHGVAGRSHPGPGPRCAAGTGAGQTRRPATKGSDPERGCSGLASLRGADTVGSDSRGYDAARGVNGRKRHIVTDTLGLLLAVMVTAAGVQDRDGGRGILKRLHERLPGVWHVWADGYYAGRLVAIAKSAWAITVQIVSRPRGQRGFAVLPRRWVVERTLAWMVRWRRLVRDYERLPETHEAMVKRAMIGLMLNRLAPPPGPKPWSNKGK